MSRADLYWKYVADMKAYREGSAPYVDLEAYIIPFLLPAGILIGIAVGMHL